jgi:glycerol-3-phosphate dehydrogenase subunit B
MNDHLHDVAIVGAGLAGMAAAVFAGDRGLDTVQVGNAGALLFSSGLLDLMGVHPVAEGRRWKDPWAAIAALLADQPQHPYRCRNAAELRAAFAELVAALGETGLAYSPPGDTNVEVVTGVGTVKSTYCVPRAMQVGAEAFAARRRCLLVDFEGLREVSARAVVESLGARWPGLRTLRVGFPEPATVGEAYGAHIARALELKHHRARLADLVRPHVGDAEAVGFPPVLGIRRLETVATELSAALGVPVFELPTIPTSVPGLRLKDALERAVSARGVQRLIHGRVSAVARDSRGFTLTVEGDPSRSTLRARTLVLATGRFMGGGLVADRQGVREAVLGLRVDQPPTRDAWHRADLFDPRGHAVNSVGVEVDATCRPLGEGGAVVHPGLFAIGTLLAHQDWVRTKCGAGIALATASAAIAEIAATRGGAA